MNLAKILNTIDTEGPGKGDIQTLFFRIYSIK